MNYKKAEGLERYTIFAPDRVNRPSQADLHAENQCPFCPENLNTDDVLDSISVGGKWKIISVKNKFPIVDTHEVIIHSPDHSLKIEDMSAEEAGLLLRMYHRRCLALKEQGEVVIFCNFGKFAGASLDHPHSQLMVIGKEIKFDHLKPGKIAGLIKEEGGFKIFTPEYSEFPYEVWIKSDKNFEDFTDFELLTAGKLLKEIVSTLVEHLSEINLLEKHFGKPHIHWKDYGVAYNFYLNTQGDFYIRIIPKLAIQAGFELATGINVNVSSPIEAAELLRKDYDE